MTTNSKGGVTMWHRIIMSGVGFLLILLAGCVTVSAPQNAQAVRSHMKCERTEQVGCLELDLLNVRWEANNPLMKGLDRPFASQEERYRRVTETGPNQYTGEKAGTVQASNEGTFVPQN